MKLNARLWILLGIAFVVFNVLAFVLPLPISPAFLIAYFCTLVMFITFAVTAARIFKKDTQAQSVLLGWPVLKVAYTALLIQAIAFFAIAAAGLFLPVWLVIILEVLYLAGAFVCLLMRDTARATVVHNEQAMQDSTALIKKLRAQAKGLAASNPRPELKADFEKLYEALRYADPVSSPATAQCETEIEALMGALPAMNTPEAMRAMIENILSKISMRAEICKAGKK